MGIVTRGVNIIAIAILTIIPIKHALADPLSEAIAAERRVDCPTAHRLYRALASSGNAEAYKRLGCVSAWGLDADRRRGHPSRINKISTLEPRVRRLRGQSSISIHSRALWSAHTIINGQEGCAMKHVMPPAGEIALADRLPTFHELASFDAKQSEPDERSLGAF
jgi:hypothetical protein